MTVMRVFPLALHLVRWKLTVVQLYWFKLCPKTMPFVPRQFVYFGSTTCKSFLFVGFARLFLPPVLARQPANHQNTASSSAQRMAAMPLCLIMNVVVLKQDRDYGRETKCCKQKNIRSPVYHNADHTELLRGGLSASPAFSLVPSVAPVGWPSRRGTAPSLDRPRATGLRSSLAFLRRR